MICLVLLYLLTGDWWPSCWCLVTTWPSSCWCLVAIVLVCGKKALLRGACQLAITLLADVAGELQFKVLIT